MSLDEVLAELVAERFAPLPTRPPAVPLDTPGQQAERRRVLCEALEDVPPPLRLVVDNSRRVA